MKKVKIICDGFECERCGYQWIPRNKTIPKNCPKCKSPYWDKLKTKFNTAKREENKNGNT